MSYNSKLKVYEGYIYLVTNKVNNKKYVGQTRTTILDRWYGHKHDAKRGKKTAFALALIKYGFENFIIDELEKIVANTEEELISLLNDKEIYYIKKYNSKSHNNGYNITSGGDNVSDYIKMKTFCFDLDGNFIKEFESRAEAGRFIGVRGEDVSGAILRNGSIKGLYFSNDNIFNYNKHSLMKDKRVISYDYNGNKLKEYSNCYEAAQDIQSEAGNIYNACLGIHKSNKGYIWRFDSDNFNDLPLPSKRKRIVNQYSKDGKYINTFESIKEAGETLGIRRSTISSVLSKNGASKSAGGYIWYYGSDPTQPNKSKIIKE